MDRIYSSYSIKAAAKLQEKSKAIWFKQGEDWAKHVLEFLSVDDESGSLDEKLSESENVTKFLCILPPASNVLVLTSSLRSNTVDKMASAVSANIERRKRLTNGTTVSAPHEANTAVTSGCNE